jgi:hypothetical protein
MFDTGLFSQTVRWSKSYVAIEAAALARDKTGRRERGSGTGRPHIGKKNRSGKTEAIVG